MEAAKRHSLALQKIRGTGPLVSGLMGMDLCLGCCQMEVHGRLNAEQAANHPFILSLRQWSTEMEMISRLAPLLPHMLPGDVRGHGSYDWMMASLPAALQADWGLELIGMMIKYPFAVEVFVQMCCTLEPSYSAEQLVDVLMETVVRVAARHDQDHVRCRGQMQVLGAQGVCRFQGLPRIMQSLGILQKLAPAAAAALSHRFRGRVLGKVGKRQTHQHAGKVISFGTTRYVLKHDLKPVKELMRVVRNHGPAPMPDISACNEHCREYQDMLRHFPRSWLLHPDHSRARKGAEPKGGQGMSSPQYVSMWVLRKHMFGQYRAGWPPANTVDVAWLRSWCPDSKGRLDDLEDSMGLHVLEIKTGCPYHELTMWLCLVGPVMQMDAHVREFMCDPQHFGTILDMIRQHQDTNGIPPTLEALGMSIRRNTVRETSPVAAVTDSGVVTSSGKKAAKKRSTVRETSPVAAVTDSGAVTSSGKKTAKKRRRMRTKQAESAAKNGRLGSDQTATEAVAGARKLEKGPWRRGSPCGRCLCGAGSGDRKP